MGQGIRGRILRHVVSLAREIAGRARSELEDHEGQTITPDMAGEHESNLLGPSSGKGLRGLATYDAYRHLDGLLRNEYPEEVVEADK